jgi:hypothetical protein
MGKNNQNLGTDMIARERNRQILSKGFDAEHDSEFVNGELVLAALYYALPKDGIVFESDRDSSIEFCLVPDMMYPETWSERWMNRDGTIRDLVKAGALIAAEIDRRLNAGEE